MDTAATRKDTWLVLVIHGVDSLGYEALQSTLLDEYFQYIKSKDDKVWVSTFGNVTKYMREREAAAVTNTMKRNKIIVALTQSLDKGMYDQPLTLKTYVAAVWKHAAIKQGKSSQQVDVMKDDKG